ncbi:MAG: hypothetical protein NC453_20375 [Muribaculum sp.]|nr:hypothetical protein [Muribaculum sp.]
MNVLNRKIKNLTDVEVIIGLQTHNPKIEKYFFDVAYRYFDLHFNQLFFDIDSKQEIFQTAIIKIWTEIENKTISVIDNIVCRRMRDGEYAEMSASLSTFLMAFAKNEFRELLHNHKDDNLDDVIIPLNCAVDLEYDLSEEDEKIQIIDECILSMSPNCIEIITLFYYQKKSLDEIMDIRGVQNSSKDGLKTAKNKCMVTLRKRVDERIKCC